MEDIPKFTFGLHMHLRRQVLPTPHTRELSDYYKPTTQRGKVHILSKIFELTLL